MLLYLAQEGCGIGLPNKLRAYTLQDGGLDTVDAHLGFANDERDASAAAAMLRQLGIDRVRLLTNNWPRSRSSAPTASRWRRVPHIFEANAHNRGFCSPRRGAAAIRRGRGHRACSRARKAAG
ncbi:MAG: hypothetical protein U1E17_04725 [Geminicoccaceae bacterium]